MSASRLPRPIRRLLRVRRPLSVFLHAGLVVFATYGAFWLRFEGAIPEAYVEVLRRAIPWIVLIRLLTFIPFRLFEGLWKYTSLWDLYNIMFAVLTSSALIWLVDSAVGWGQPRSTHILSAILLVCLMGGVRMARRVYREVSNNPSGARRVLVYGAGDAGELIVRDMKLNPGYDATPVGFIDDDPRKIGNRIHGIPVLGTGADLAALMDELKPDDVLIAIPGAAQQELRALVHSLTPFKVRITTLPNLQQIVNGGVQVSQIRALQVEDLLTRAPVGLDQESLHTLIAGRRVLVTGAGGSIGSELCRQIAGFGPASLVLLDRYENSLFTIYHAIDDQAPTFAVHAVVGDITDLSRLDAVFAEHRPDIVFHAAAHKHVPLMESNPCEAVKNNVRGSRMVAEAADRYGVGRFILVSTDKAVNPTSVMGATKRAAEFAVREVGRSSRTRMVIVRFGNVLGSNGSVVPRFLEQIRKGGPVTVTHPDVRRYFMLIPEAVQLVLHAAALDDPGSVYVLEMGEQIKLVEMARDLIRLSGSTPDEDIAITFIGLRPGEKMSEELVGSDEIAEPSRVDKLMRVRPTGPHPLNGRLPGAIQELEQLAEAGDAAAVLRQLRVVVQNFTPAAPVPAGPAVEIRG